MEQTQNNPTGERNSFKRKLGNTTHNVIVHFNEDSAETIESISSQQDNSGTLYLTGW